MSNFKKGDRVVVTSVSSAYSSYYQAGNTGVVLSDSDSEHTKVDFDEPHHCEGGRWWGPTEDFNLVPSGVNLRDGHYFIEVNSNGPLVDAIVKRLDDLGLECEYDVGSGHNWKNIVIDCSEEHSFDVQHWDGTSYTDGATQLTLDQLFDAETHATAAIPVRKITLEDGTEITLSEESYQALKDGVS